MFYIIPLVATLATFYGTSHVLSKLFNNVTSVLSVFGHSIPCKACIRFSYELWDSCLHVI